MIGQVRQLEGDAASPELLEMVRLLGGHARNTASSDKQTELWQVGGKEEVCLLFQLCMLQRGAKTRRETAECVEDSPLVSQVVAEVLVTVQETAGGMDTRLMRECLLPLLSHIASTLKTDPELAAALCQTFAMARERVENKVFLKEITKVSGSVWQQFYRSVLKYSLKSSSPAGAAPLQLLADICEFLMHGSKLAEAGTLHQLATQHSHYTAVMAGPGSSLKTATVNLLLALCPVSCTLDGVAVLLAGYRATLHPSDRAILALLQRHETMAGLDLAPFQPLVWGPAAAQHYAATGSGGWGEAKCSEVLALLEPGLVTRTCDAFPLHLYLDPELEVAEAELEDEGVYDPRFLLPLLSHLLSSDVYIDKHVKFLESGALGLALCSLASRDRAMRAAGYHVVSRLHAALQSAKLSQEKQVNMSYFKIFSSNHHQSSVSAVCRCGGTW